MGMGFGEEVAAGLLESIVSSRCSISILSPTFFLPNPNKRRFLPGWSLVLSESCSLLWLAGGSRLLDAGESGACSDRIVCGGFATALIQELLLEANYPCLSQSRECSRNDEAVEVGEIGSSGGGQTKGDCVSGAWLG